MTESKFQQGLSNPLAIVSDGKPVLVLVPTHNHSVDGESVRKFASMLDSHYELVKALEAARDVFAGKMHYAKGREIIEAALTAAGKGK